MTALPLFNAGAYSLSLTGNLQIAISRIAGIPLSRIQAMNLSDNVLAAMLAQQCWDVNRNRPYGDPRKVSAIDD